jgi:carbon-monoxide dehydrogenase medium subunit
MSYWKNYILAETIGQALHVLENAAGPAHIVAGGTDFLLDLQQGRQSPFDTLVDVTKIDELCRLELRPEGIFIGAAVPLNQVIASLLVQAHAQALFEAASLIGGPQVRNTATLGGNVAHALPAGDGTIALLALGAQAEIARKDGLYRRPVQQLFRGPGKTALDEKYELLVGFYLPTRSAGEASAFQRVMRPQGVAIAILNCGLWLRRDSNRIADIRIAVGPAGPTPFRAEQTESILRGREWYPELGTDAASTLLGEAKFRSSPHRASADYRRLVAKALLESVLNQAWRRSTSDASLGMTGMANRRMEVEP